MNTHDKFNLEKTLKNKPSRNDTCHCGSGKKLKNCHGKTIE
ncbi:MAG: hypothetical protein HOD18_00655, partial [Candidatus Marinimicrobia bacterium]|nr:hypothetical protein [Candidatus Neomarinimicrobiota bacterium]